MTEVDLQIKIQKKTRLFLIVILGFCFLGCADFSKKENHSYGRTVSNDDVTTTDQACLLTQDLTFEPLAEDEPVQSPGVGFLADLYPQQGQGSYNSHYLINTLHNHLGRMYVRLDLWKDGSDLPASFLNQFDADLDKVRQDGLKVTLRFAYNYPCDTNNAAQTPGAFKPEHSVCPQDQGKTNLFNDAQFGDASAATIIKHIQQLSPILQKHADVIAGLGGFIGYWGEQHHSTNGLTTLVAGRLVAESVAAQVQIYQALLKATSSPILMRYPQARLQIFDSNNAHHLDSINAARIGLHNDCFLSSDRDVGTYISQDSVGLAAEKAYVAQVGAAAYMGGETCHVNAPRSQCATALSELTQMHFSFLTEGFPAAVFDSWKNPNATDPQAPCYTHIRTHLGYRLSLVDLELTTAARPGALVSLKLNLRNSGFAKLSGSRPASVVLQCGAWTSGLIALSGVDASEWPSGVTTQVVTSFEIPQETPVGICSLSLSLADANSSIQSDPRYAVQLANKNVWNSSTGLNLLTSDFKVIQNSDCKP